MQRTQKAAEYGLIALILVLLCIASQRIFYRCDLTDDERFTLSSASKTAVEGLDDTLTIKAFFSDNIPQSQAATINGVKDLLAEYKAHGGAKVQVEFIDPYDDPETTQEMRLLGIPELTMTVLSRDELEQRKVYMGMGLFYGDRKEVIQKVDRLNELEYGITSAILKVTREKQLSVGIWLGNPDANSKPFWEDYERYKLDDELEQLYMALRRQYNVIEVNFGGGRPVPESVNTLLVIGPRKASERDLYEIDQFIMRGGKVIFLLDVQDHNEQMQANAMPTGLEPMLESYGISIEQSVVADARCERAPFQTRFFRSIAPYPFWPKMTGDGINQSNPALSGLQAVVLPWTSPIKVFPSRLGERKFTELLRSSELSKAHEVPVTLVGEQQGLLPAGPETELTLAGVLEGPFESYFKGKQMPPPSVPEGGMPAPIPASEVKEFVPQTDAGRIVVVGSSTFITENPLNLYAQMNTGAQNLPFVENLVDWLTLGEGLIGIRSRVAASYPLETASETAKQLIQITNLIAIPLLVILFGVGHFLLRRRDRMIYEERYRLTRRSSGKGSALQEK